MRKKARSNVCLLPGTRGCDDEMQIFIYRARRPSFIGTTFSKLVGPGNRGGLPFVLGQLLCWTPSGTTSFILVHVFDQGLASTVFLCWQCLRLHPTTSLSALILQIFMKWALYLVAPNPRAAKCSRVRPWEVVRLCCCMYYARSRGLFHLLGPFLRFQPIWESTP